MSSRASVRVPASTSNLGPGFDCLGLALDLYLEVEARALPANSAPVRTVRGAEADGWPEAGEDLVLRAFERGASELGLVPPPLSVAITTEVPIGRGLGSSGAAVAAGLRLAEAFANETLPLDRALALGIELEGHPDNVTASLVGGATLCVPIEGEAPALTRLDLSPDLAFALAWPRERLETAAARRVLPATVPFADAVENARRLGLLIGALRSGDPRLLALGGEDRLHERHRLPLVPGAADALARARELGATLATLSGSGSALVAVCPQEACQRVAEGMRSALEDARPGATARTARAVTRGAEVLEANGA